MAGACCLADGALAAALALTRDHVATRRQFGRPLAAFQAVAQQIADVYIASRTLHLVTQSACWQLDAAKEVVTFRNAPEWAKVQALSARYRDAWMQGLDKGFFFVARTHAAVEPSFAAGKLDAPLALQSFGSEAFHDAHASDALFDDP